MTNPDNVGGLPSGMVMVQRIDAERLAMSICDEDSASERLSARRVLELCRAAPAGGDGLRLLVKELRESLEGVVRVADRQTDEFNRARSAIARAAHVFVNAGDSEAQFIADGENLDCPTCGGSGHAGDSAPAGGDVPSWRNVSSAIDAKALATATEIALMWGNDRSQFVSRIQVAVIDAMRWMGEGDCQRSTHHVHRGPESLPCYCAGTNDHPIGQEVAKDSAPAGSGEVDLDYLVPFAGEAYYYTSGMAWDTNGIRAALEDFISRTALLRKLQQGAEETQLVLSSGCVFCDLNVPHHVQDYVIVRREDLRTEARRLRYRAGECWPTFSTGTDAGAQMIGTAEALEQFASQGQEGGANG